ncbi:HAD family hydrolase [Aquabacter spiritensis]|uniref:phosphoglycolate phosphatase n=1 Tax=Aquabacter spiritensis TaxID=933073 RepID=A0A4R3LUL0_9HYPH|nr:HAD family hydrolase [Aquabacter spiritensis]TCT03319.1 phosphoglycolate phosphatase [Aquabacter spiritensis]
MRDLAAILFDKDGTLIDFDRTWGPAAGAVMRTLAGSDAHALHRIEAVSHFLPSEERFLPSSPLVAGSSAHYGPLWAEALGRPADAAFLGQIDRLFSIEGMRSLSPIGHPAAVVARLHQAGMKIGIVTNDAEANARLQADALGLLPFVTEILGYDSGHGSKPDPGMVLAAADRLGVAPRHIAVVGDSAHDLAAAHGAGARFILVRTGPGDPQALYAEADLVLDSISDLPHRLIEAAPC